MKLRDIFTNLTFTNVIITLKKLPCFRGKKKKKKKKNLFIYLFILVYNRKMK